MMFLMMMMVTSVSAIAELNQTGCDRVKTCLFKPIGCNPALDCTIGIIMHVNEPGWLRIEMTALAINPSTTQYIAVGFSNDQKMVSNG